jgi:hypothetical protein
MLLPLLTLTMMTSSGGLLGDRIPAPGLLLGRVNPTAFRASLEHMSLAELMDERDRLTNERPSIWFGLGLTIGGAVAVVTGVIMMAVGFYTEVLATGFILALAGVGLLIAGPIILFSALRAQRAADQQLKVVDQRVEALKQGDTAPPLLETPPPPPARPPDVELVPSLFPSLTVATF